LNFKVIGPNCGSNPQNVAQEWCWPITTPVESKHMLSSLSLQAFCILFKSSTTYKLKQTADFTQNAQLTISSCRRLLLSKIWCYACHIWWRLGIHSMWPPSVSLKSLLAMLPMYRVSCCSRRVIRHMISHVRRHAIHCMRVTASCKSRGEPTHMPSCVFAHYVRIRWQCTWWGQAGTSTPLRLCHRYLPSCHEGCCRWFSRTPCTLSMRYRFAHGPADATATLCSISCSSKSRLFLTFWCRLTQVVSDKIQESRKTVAHACVRACVRACMRVWWYIVVNWLYTLPCSWAPTALPVNWTQPRMARVYG